VVRHIPSIGPILDQTAVVNQRLTFLVHAIDKDGDRVYLSMRCKTTADWFSCASLGMDLRPVTGDEEVNATFRWTPQAPAIVRVQFHANDRVDGIGVRDVIITVPGLQADLAVTDLSWSPAAPTLGQAVAFTVTVQNQGEAGIEATSIACRLSSPTGTLIGESYLITFMPGETRSISCGSHTFSQAGFNLIYGLVDGGGADVDPVNDMRFEGLNVGSGGMGAFSDVPPSHWASDYIGALYAGGYVAGTQSEPVRLYSPERDLNRAEIAVFLVRAEHPAEAGYVPPIPPQVIWEDELEAVAAFKGSAPAARAASHWHDKWTVEMYELGLTAGCSANPPKYCPYDPAAREQMAVYAVRVLHGSDFTPPAAGLQLFGDVPLLNADGGPNWAAKWIEQAYRDQLIQACQTDLERMLFRPKEATDRAEAACMVYQALAARGDLP